MITSNLPGSCSSIVARKPRLRLTLLRSHSARPGRAAVTATSKLYYSSRTSCWWRRKLNVRYYGPTDPLVEKTRQRQYMGGYHHRSGQPTSDTERTTASGQRSYSDDKDKESEPEKDHIDRFPRYDDLLRRRMAIWKRLFDEDPYNAMFGPSNSALKGRGWQHPLWNSIPRWMQEEFGIQDRKSPSQSDASKPTTISFDTPKSDTTPRNSKGADKVEVSEKASAQTETSDPGKPQNSYVYDPITGRMVAAHSLPNVEVDSQPQNEPIVNIPVKPYSATQSNDSTKKEERDRRIETTFWKRLAQLPEDDADILLPGDIRARIDGLRARKANMNCRSRSEKKHLDRAFDQIHTERTGEEIKRPNLRAQMTSFRIKPDRKAFENVQENIWSPNIEGHVNSTNNTAESISIDEFRERFSFERTISSEQHYAQYLKERASLVKSHAKRLQDIRRRMPYESGMELAKLDDAQNAISQQIGVLRKLYHFRFAEAKLALLGVERLELMAILHHRGFLGPRVLVDLEKTLSVRQRIPSLRTDPVRSLEDGILQQVSTQWEDNHHDKDPRGVTTSGEERVYSGIEGRDIHDMAQSVTFQSSPSKEDEMGSHVPSSAREHIKANDFAEEAFSPRKSQAPEDELNVSLRERSSHTESKSEAYAHEGMSILTAQEAGSPLPEPNELSTEAIETERILESENATPSSELDAAAIESTPSNDQVAPEIAPEVAVPSPQIQETYKFIAYDRSTKDVVINTLSAPSDATTETTIPIHQALSRLSAPSKFLPHISSQWDVVSSSSNLLVLRTFDENVPAVPASASDDSTAAVKSTNLPRINPIDGTSFHLPQAPSGNFASPTGFVSFENPSDSVPQPVQRGVEQEETRERGEKDNSRKDKSRKERGRERRGGGVSRVFVAGISGATVCYVAGVVGELLK